MSVAICTAPHVRVVPGRAAHNVFWLIAERGMKAVGGVAMAILIARHLSPEHYGRYGAAIGISTLAKEAVMLGFDRMLRRDLAARPSEAGKILGTSLVLGLTLGIGVALALTGLADRLVDDQETKNLTLILVWMALPQAFFSFEIWFESAGQTRPLVWTRNVVWTVAMSVRVLLVITHGNVYSFATVALAEWAVTYAAVYCLVRSLHPELALGFERTRLVEWFKEGWPMIAMVAVGSTSDRIMVMLVHTLATNAEAGFFNAALRIMEIWCSISTIIAAVLLPKIVNFQRSDPERSEKAAGLYANASLVVAMAAAAFVTLTAPVAIPLLFGPAYASSARVLVILFWSGPPVFSAVSRAQLWVSRRRLAQDLPSVALIAALQLSFTAYLVPKYGAIGAASAMTAAQWLGFYSLALIIPTLRDGSRYQLHAFKALLAPIDTGRQIWSFVTAMLPGK